MRRTNWSGAAALACVTVVGFSSAASAQSAAKATEPQVTFTKDVAPILQRACQNCHRPNNIAPMSLLTYEVAAVGAFDSGESVRAGDAAVVHRP